jgi:hypothetical protein
MPLSSDRRFRFWDYNVSHDQMLIRSPKSFEFKTNVDIVMWGVEYLDLPTSLDGVTMASASLEELGRAEQSLGRKLGSSQVFCFISGDSHFLVVAAGFKILENDLDIFDSSLEYFAGTDSSRELGAVIAHSSSGVLKVEEHEHRQGRPLPDPS